MLSRWKYGPGAVRYPTRLYKVSRRFVSKLPPKSSTVAKFHFPVATHSIHQINQNLDKFLTSENLRITLNGHLHKKPRIMTTRSFAEIRDETGVTQLLLTPESTNPSLFDLLKSSGVEDSISVTGYIQKKQVGGSSTWELVVEDYQILNSSNLDAARLDKLKHLNPQDIPGQFRYLQLRTPKYQQALRKRSKAAMTTRQVLVNNHGFTEIETPLLFKSTPEGAREFLVPTRQKGQFYALPQSPQQYKQILMSSGFTRYFQLAKCFRDEDLRSDRQPEFTQIDMEMSFIDNSDQVGVVVEDVITSVWKGEGKSIYRLNGEVLENVPEISPANLLQFSKLDYFDALTRYGIDKPDLRSDLRFQPLSDFFISANPDFPVIEVCVLREAFDPSKPFKLPSAFVDKSSYSRRKPIVLALKTAESAENWYQKFVEKEVFRKTENFDDSKLQSLLNLKEGDVIAFSTRSEFPYENPTPLGRFRQLAITEFPNKWNRPILQADGTVLDKYNREDIFVGSWVVNFPLFNPVDNSSSTDEYPLYDFKSYESTHHPFTMAKLEDYDLLESGPLKVRGEHYDLVINGVEVGGGSRRIHDAALQQYIFEEILSILNYQALFGHLLKALSMGCPPHAGLAIGFDRICAMLIGSSSIRDVIAFPKNQSGIDPVVESPTEVGENRLKDYFIEVSD
ncbi:uncharacterized protein CANTADRAFT_89937 [Suhomyces tanzawaensis NRRL Y-17324]|uniref:Aminoacyl-transfer RNA synthetases class-II family profile domain-containing protein n=1 Tax=Suhomyces tanzawaensis NRRL Y-17324 TaxID=984487 RepID=A0A1E4SLV8_9ASCO|nr:uncharacterized protein CANTADRAFT_89937 [Suhomyces tanzawaensis NRRL Y-17324]ODV80387.1 hypothetical protein CANTADRAFT_89937 [Suhomyces tanzawaensis NRRL Y-17324]